MQPHGGHFAAGTGGSVDAGKATARHPLERRPRWRTVFPYENRWKWWLRPRQQHLVDALEQRPVVFQGTQGQQLRRRVRAIERWLRVRLALVLLLSFSIIAGATTWILDAVDGPEEAATAVQVASRVASGLAGLFSVLYIFTLRTLGQLEIDALLLLPPHRA